MMAPFFLAALAAILSTCAHAGASMPAEAPDPRVRLVRYDPHHVTEIKVQRGTVTRIVLGEAEKIQADGAGTGFPSDCGKPELEWCLRAEPGGNQVLVKPQEGATHNNLELKTDLRDYSMVFEVIADRAKSAKPAGPPPMHRVVFVYPAPQVTQPGPSLAPAAADPPPATARELLSAARPSPRNWHYTMQVMAGADDIVPEMVFDDGRFTYFRFPANREMPTIFHVSPAGEEGRVNFHIDEHAPDTVVVERMSRRFLLRLGKAVIGIWNDAFDPYGLPPHDGSTVDNVSRTLRKE